MEDLKGKDIYRCYFEPVEGILHQHKCNACTKTFKQNIAFGYANLKEHLERQHADYKEVVRRFLYEHASGPMDSFIIQPSQKAKNMYGWISWIVDDNLPFSFVESKSMRANMQLTVTSVKTVKKYMYYQCFIEI